MRRKLKGILSLALAIALLAGVFIPSITREAQALSYSGSASYESGKFYRALTQVKLTGNPRVDIVNVAKSQVGYQEGGSKNQLSGEVLGSGNFTEYGRWYGMQDMWCAMFASWCADVAGISTNVIPSHSYTPNGLQWFRDRGQAYSSEKILNGEYTPQAGDLIYFRSSRNTNRTNHVGIVTGYADGIIYTVEGNTSAAGESTNGGIVAAKSYPITNTYIVYVCCPAYSIGGTSVEEEEEDQVTAPQPPVQEEPVVEKPVEEKPVAAKPADETDYWIPYSMKYVVFDAKYYLDRYPELAQTCGTDNWALYLHFLKTGAAEGRQGSPLFDVKYFIANNPEVKSKYGTDYVGAMKYYFDNASKYTGTLAQPENLGSDFCATIINDKFSKVVSIDGSNAWVESSSVQLSQIWRFVRQSDGSYQIINQATGKYLTAASKNPTDGTNVTTKAESDSAAQKWFVYLRKGSYMLRCAADVSHVLDVDRETANLQLYTNGCIGDQRFKIEKVELNSAGATADQMAVLRKVIYSVETGGDAYYDSITYSYAAGISGRAITIGSGQWYGSEARALLLRIRSADEKAFAELDTAGIGEDLDTRDWNSYQISPDSDKAACIREILCSEAGVRVQDEMIDERMQSYLQEVAALGVTEQDAQMLCAGLRHLGGTNAVKRVLARVEGELTLENIYAALSGAEFRSLQASAAMLYNAVERYISE